MARDDYQMMEGGTSSTHWSRGMTSEKATRRTKKEGTIRGSKNNYKSLEDGEYVTAWDEAANELVKVDLPAHADRVPVWDDNQRRFVVRNHTSLVSQLANRSRTSEQPSSRRGRSPLNEERDRTPRSWEVKVEHESIESGALYSTPTSGPARGYPSHGRGESKSFVEPDKTLDMAWERLADPSRTVGETKADHMRRMAAAQRATGIFTVEVETEERELRECRERVARRNEELTRQEDELERRLGSLSAERKRMED